MLIDIEILPATFGGGVFLARIMYLVMGICSLTPSNLLNEREVMIMANPINARYNTISAALNIIDPEGTFVPGSVEHNWVTGTLLSWMDEMEPDEVLQKSESARRMFRNKRRIFP